MDDNLKTAIELLTQVADHENALSVGMGLVVDIEQFLRKIEKEQENTEVS